MNAQLLQLKNRIAALSLRERAMVFAAACALVVYAGHALVLAPQLTRQTLLQGQIDGQHASLAALDGAITGRVQAYGRDPDAPARARLDAIKTEMTGLGRELLALEHGLVPPERMGPLVDGILRANGRLKLVSMRTLPVEAVAAPGAPVAAPGDTPATPLLYRHGVEVTVRGNYLDMVDYMSALDAMQTRMFWGRAQLDVDAYPAARLTLTLHTVSLDRQWMKL